MNKVILFFFSILFYFIFLLPAYAYLDPGTISIVLQSILAAIAGIVATYKLWLSKLKSFILKFKTRFKNKNRNSNQN